MEKKYFRDDFIGFNIEDVVKKLQECHRNGQLVQTLFNGVMLYSDTVTLDDAYKSITGHTKSEFDAAVQKDFEDRKKKKEEHIKNVPTLTMQYMQKGREILSSDKWADWDKIVPTRLHDLYEGMELQASLDIIKILNEENDFEKANKIFESQSHSGASYSLVKAIVSQFADNGEIFEKWLNTKN